MSVVLLGFWRRLHCTSLVWQRGILQTGPSSRRYLYALGLMESLWPAFTHLCAGLHLSQCRVPASPCLVQQQWTNSSTYHMLDPAPSVEFQKASPRFIPHVLESGFEPRASASGSVFLSAAELYWFHPQGCSALLANPQGQVCGRSFQQLVLRCPERAPVGQGRPRPGVGMGS